MPLRYAFCGIRRDRARRAAFRIGLADDDRRPAQLGNEATIWKPFAMARSWLLMPIRTWPVDEPRRALGVERDEVERRPILPVA